MNLLVFLIDYDNKVVIVEVEGKEYKELYEKLIFVIGFILILLLIEGVEIVKGNCEFKVIFENV